MLMRLVFAEYICSAVLMLQSKIHRHVAAAWTEYIYIYISSSSVMMLYMMQTDRSFTRNLLVIT